MTNQPSLPAARPGYITATAAAQVTHVDRERISGSIIDEQGRIGIGEASATLGIVITLTDEDSAAPIVAGIFLPDDARSFARDMIAMADAIEAEAAAGAAAALKKAAGK